MTNVTNNKFTQKAIDYINSLKDDFDFDCEKFYQIAEEAVDSEEVWDFNDDFAWAYAVVMGIPVFVDDTDDTQKLLYWRYAAHEHKNESIKYSMELQKSIYLIRLMTASADNVVH